MDCPAYNTKMGLESPKYLRKMSLHEGPGGNHEAGANRCRGGCEPSRGSLAYPGAGISAYPHCNWAGGCAMKKIGGHQSCGLLREESGQTVLFVALFLGLVALGFIAFALDAGVLFRAKRMAESAAQAAAVAAAEQMGVNNASNEQAVANGMAKLNGFDTTLSTNPATVTLTTPSTGNFTGSYVQEP